MSYKKGDKVIVAIEKHSNASRYVDMSLENINEWTYEGKVISSGRKYVTVEFKGFTEKFEIENNYKQKVSCGSCDYKLYKNIEEVKEEREKEAIYNKIRFEFSMYGKSDLSLETLRGIVNLIENDKK